MLKKSFFNRQRTAVTLLIKGTSIEELIGLARAAEFDGADGIAVDLCELPLGQRTQENYRRLMNEVHLPFMFLDYRSDQFCHTDEERQKYLLDAAEAGAEVIDVMGDLFAPAQFELAVDPEAIAKQKDLIAQIHSRGAKVIMSSHVYDANLARPAEEILAHLREQASRGADILKIVTPVNTEAELLEAIRTTMLLNRELDCPFTHLCNGTFSRIHRLMGPQLGCHLTFAVHDYTVPSPLYNQPTIRAFKSVMDNMHWHLDDVQIKNKSNA